MELLQGKENAAKAKSLEVAEDAREEAWKHPSFVGGLFTGNVNWDLVCPFPAQSAEDKAVGDAFLAKLGDFLKKELDADEVDRTGIIPDKVYKGLAELGCFGMKIPKEYGGLGLSQTNYNRAVGLVASHCGSTAVLLSAHQSIGVPQPLKMFGTPEQKQKYLPLLAKGAISAFALTEPEVGSDPAQMSTTATPTPDGRYYLLNGDKLWCTNGPIADILIVMAKTPPKIVRGKEKTQITAFIVEKGTPGFEVVHRCRFMGLNGIQNGLLRFKDVKVPRENIVWGEGQGLKLALITLNTGRLTVPAACSAMARAALGIVRKWGNERVQWGAPIGRHEAITSKIARMSAMTFAMDAVTWLTSALADKGKADIRLEAAMAKLFCTEAAWLIADDTVQIRGGRGYETADSLRGRGEPGIPAERMLRDTRINLIIEGTSQIMRLFIAREAMDPHLSRILPLLSGRTPLGQKLSIAARSLAHYAAWYPRLWMPGGRTPAVPSRLAGHARYVDRAARKLARDLFHAMAVHQQGLEKKQKMLERFVNIGADLFAMSCAISYAAGLVKSGAPDRTPEDLADVFCRDARQRIAAEFDAQSDDHDRLVYTTGRAALEGRYHWLEKDIL